MPHSESSKTGRFAVAGAILLWATGNIIVRETPMPGAQIAFWRFSLGAVVYSVALRASGKRLSWTHLRASAIAGAAVGLVSVFFFIAIKHTTVANATVLANLQPLVVISIGVRHFGERATRWITGATIVALAGAALVVFGSTSVPVWSPYGDALALVAMFLFAAYFIFAKKARSTVPAFEFQTAVWVVGTVVLAPIAVIDAGGLVLPSTTQWVWLLVLLAIPGTGHLLMNWAHSRVRLTLASVLTLALPALSSIGAVIILDEPLGPWQILGIVIVTLTLAAVVLSDTRTGQQLPSDVVL